MTITREPDYLDEPVVYLCKFADHTHTLKPRRKVLVDGEAIIDPGVRLKFSNHRCSVRDANVVRLMEHAMKYTNIGKLIKRGPMKAEEPKEPESFADMLEKRKQEKTSNLVTGVRGVSTGGT
jgi:hypothetical protein